MRKRGRLLPGDETSIARMIPARIIAITRSGLKPYLLPTSGGVCQVRFGFFADSVAFLRFDRRLRGMILPRLLDVGR